MLLRLLALRAREILNYKLKTKREIREVIILTTTGEIHGVFNSVVPINAQSDQNVSG